MLATVLAATLLIQTPLDVSDYFPFREGTVRLYEEEMTARGKKYNIKIIETVGKEVTIKRFEKYIDPDDKENPEKYRPIEEKAFEVLTSLDGDNPVPTYYQVRDNRVFIAGVEEGKLLPRVYPIFAVGDDPENWIFSGEISVMGAPAPTIIEGTTRSRKDYKFDGKEYPAVETVLSYRINFGTGLEAVSEQKSVYAKGIGLVEYEETGKMGSNSTHRKRKLVKLQKS